MKALTEIQQKLKAPKNQFNSFGKYSYRSCEDILEAVKPLLDGAILTLSDEIEAIGTRHYVKATATFSKSEEIVTVTAYAREEETKKGMDAAQITGACSSYARKYALNGLFLIDDTKDADATNKHGKNPPETPQDAPQAHESDVPDFTAQQIVGALKKQLGVKMKLSGIATAEEQKKFYQYCTDGLTESVDVVQNIIDRYDEYLEKYKELA